MPVAIMSSPTGARSRYATRQLMIALAGLGLAWTGTPVSAACGDPDAFGVSRQMTIDTRGGLELGVWSYDHTLNLRDKEVVLTIDGGPVPGVTDRVLDALANACS